MDTPWYDDPGKIMKTIVEGGLKGLNEVAHARHEAHYDRGERLNDYIIEGSWYTDSCGNWGKLQWPKGRPDLAFMLVLTPAGYNEFCVVTGLPTNWSASMAWELPPDGMVCDICLEPWMIQDAHTAVVNRTYEDIPLERFAGKSLREVEKLIGAELSATVFLQPELMIQNPAYVGHANHPVFEDVVVRDEGERGWVYKANKDTYLVQPGDSGYFNVWTYRHPLCQENRLRKLETNYFEEIFTKSGYKQVVLNAIPNEYCGDPTCCGPWFLVRTEVGNFKVGWRKRVINLEWAGKGVGPERDLTHLFKGESTTLERDYVHAHGREKLIDYLRRIRNYQLTL